MSKNNSRKEEWVSVPKFMEYYDLPSATAYRLIHEKNFPCNRISKRAYRVDLSKVDEWFNKNFN
ncbi:hypothetical protein SDC9_79014 [bioreactor metagenome]|uniref:Helix-turn-helix domain-containing protein n=1 Tax=bioreactor metagenome TaxID=1076179 RepID=A0A644YVF2_9ZZZZ